VAELVKTQPFCSSALIKLLFKNAVVRCRMAASHLGIILSDFITDLHKRGYSPEGVRHHVLVVEHFGHWLKCRGVRPHQLSTGHVQEFLSSHLPRCHCPQPARKVRQDCRAPLRRLVEFLRRRKGIRECVTKSVVPSPVDRLIAAYDRHMERVCGLSVEVRRRRRLCARQFLKWRFGVRAPQLSQLRAKQVRSFVLSRARQLGPTGIRALAVSLRSFLKFLEFSGRLRPGLAGFVPQPVAPLPPPPPRILEPEQWRKYLKSFQRSTPKGRRDYAIVLCLAELALRSQEVVSLTLDDLDWRAMTIRLAQTKQQRQRLLPLPKSVAKAILSYLKHGRPATESRALFVDHRAPVGQPLTAQTVRIVVRRAFARCGIPASGSYILRHTWATRAHRRGAGLKLIADLLGHRSLESTIRYAHVNLEELRQAALPWPKIKP
jgi:integrase/recombinase XerD